MPKNKKPTKSDHVQFNVKLGDIAIRLESKTPGGKLTTKRYKVTKVGVANSHGYPLDFIGTRVGGKVAGKEERLCPFDDDLFILPPGSEIPSKLWDQLRKFPRLSVARETGCSWWCYRLFDAVDGSVVERRTTIVESGLLRFDVTNGECVWFEGKPDAEEGTECLRTPNGVLFLLPAGDEVQPYT